MEIADATTKHFGVKLDLAYTRICRAGMLNKAPASFKDSFSFYVADVHRCTLTTI